MNEKIEKLKAEMISIEIHNKLKETLTQQFINAKQ